MSDSAKQPTPQPDTDDLEYDVEAVLAACNGDARAAVRSLLIANSFLEQRIERLMAVASVGYARGKIPKPPASA